MALSSDLEKIFPLTLSLLEAEESQRFQHEFEKDWGFERLHFFPMLLKSHKCPQKILEVGDYEYLQFFLQSQTFSAVSSGPHLQLNTSLQFFPLRSASEILGKEPGLYLLWKSAGQVQERKATFEEAQLLDRLREDQMLFEADLSSQEKEIAENFFAWGILQPS
ncbi:MAG: hypothetical protein ACAH59_02220 [Pseudobdellovibrionaceae bacterium]